MPLDRGIIDQQLQALGEATRWWDERELRDLPAVLHTGEHILAVARGKLARVRLLRRSWLIVVTEKRLLCMRAAGRSWRQFEIPGSQIRRVSYRVGPFRGRVLIVTGAHTYKLLVPKADGYKLLAALSGVADSGEDKFPGFGPTRVVRRVFDHILSLPAAALNPEPPGTMRRVSPDTSATDKRVEMLEEQVQALQQQVDFLEQLLHDRARPRPLIGLGADDVNHPVP